MHALISKTEYIEYLDCKKNSWLKRYKTELLESFRLSAFELALLEQGNEVDVWARLLFPDGVFVPAGEGSVEQSKVLLEQKTKAIFQPTTIYDVFLARHDILEYDPVTESWNLYEVKSTSKVKESSKEVDHIEDAAFQLVVLEQNGYIINKIFVVCLNKDYIRFGELDTEQLFKKEDMTTEVRERAGETLLKMSEARSALLQEDETVLECLCIYRGRSMHCTTFAYSHKHVPPYSVHDLYRIGNSKKKLAELVDREIWSLDDIPDDFNLTPNQQLQVKIHKSGTPHIDRAAIQQELENLKYPLYFLDFETLASAIPLYNGYHPYQQITFQFSVHIVEKAGDEPIHKEFLFIGKNNPSKEVATKLLEYIGETGSVVSWHKSFERDRIKELAELCPDYSERLLGIADRLYDLEDIFSKRLYVHPDFKGRTSIKKVLPVLVPELSYKDLDIREGGTASQKWREMCFDDISESAKNKIAYDLIKYCGLDTFAMYAIWKTLIKI